MVLRSTKKEMKSLIKEAIENEIRIIIVFIGIAIFHEVAHLLIGLVADEKYLICNLLIFIIFILTFFLLELRTARLGLFFDFDASTLFFFTLW